MYAVLHVKVANPIRRLVSYFCSLRGRLVLLALSCSEYVRRINATGLGRWQGRSSVRKTFYHAIWLRLTCADLFSFVGGLSVLYAYFLDVYEARTDAVLVIFNGVKNFAGFGITYAVFPWTAASGFTIPFVVLAMIVLVAHLLILALVFVGPRVRKWTARHFVTGRSTQHGDAF